MASIRDTISSLVRQTDKVLGALLGMVWESVKGVVKVPTTIVFISSNALALLLSIPYFLYKLMRINSSVLISLLLTITVTIIATPLITLVIGGILVLSLQGIMLLLVQGLVQGWKSGLRQQLNTVVHEISDLPFVFKSLYLSQKIFIQLFALLNVGLATLYVDSNDTNSNEETSINFLTKLIEIIETFDSLIADIATIEQRYKLTIRLALEKIRQAKIISTLTLISDSNPGTEHLTSLLNATTKLGYLNQTVESSFNEFLSYLNAHPNEPVSVDYFWFQNQVDGGLSSIHELRAGLERAITAFQKVQVTPENERQNAVNELNGAIAALNAIAPDIQPPSQTTAPIPFNLRDPQLVSAVGAILLSQSANSQRVSQDYFENTLKMSNASIRFQALTPNEQSSYSTHPNSDVKALLTRYNTLSTKLNEDECPILFARPEPENTVVLTKQYCSNNSNGPDRESDSWQSVPNQSVIFDKQGLSQLCCNNTMSGPIKHPTTRDPLLSPNCSKHVINGVSYKTRYRYHDYYGADTNTICSQELGEIAAELRRIPPVRQERSSATVIAMATNTAAATAARAPSPSEKQANANRLEALARTRNQQNQSSNASSFYTNAANNQQTPDPGLAQHTNNASSNAHQGCPI